MPNDAKKKPSQKRTVENILSDVEKLNIPGSSKTEIEVAIKALKILLNGSDDLLKSEELERIKQLNENQYLVKHGFLSLSAVFRPHKREIEGLFSNKDVMNLMENGPSFRKFGWDLSGLSEARPVEGEYYEALLGNLKTLRIYRDGQIVVAGSLSNEFLAWGANNINLQQYQKSMINALAVSEYITSFVNFLEMFRVNGEIKDAKSIIVQIGIKTSLGENVLFFPKQLFEQTRGTFNGGEKSYQRQINLDESGVDTEKISFELIEWFYQLFGLRSEKFMYVDVSNRKVDMSNFRDY